LRRVARSHRGPTDGAGRLKGVGWTVRVCATAVLGRVARAGRRATLEAAWPESIAGAGGADSGTGLLEVAHSRRGTADDATRLQTVGRASTRGARAVLRHVALAGRGTTLGGGGFEAVHAGVAGPAAVIGVVAGPALRDASAGRRRRGEDIGRAGTRGAGAVLGHVALAGGGETLGGGGFDIG